MEEDPRDLVGGWADVEPASPICVGCNKSPEEIDEYIAIAENYGDGTTPTQFVKEEEGTYNPKNGHFTCTKCYIKMGQPSSPTGWRAP